jgi:2-dehydropantoate 2-reductase
LAHRAIAEGEAALTAAGITAVSAETDTGRRGNILLRRSDGLPPAGGSTWQSMSRGTGTIETDYLSGEIVLLGRLHGIPTPVNDLVRRVAIDLARSGGDPRSRDAADLLASLDHADASA